MKLSNTLTFSLAVGLALASSFAAGQQSRRLYPLKKLASVSLTVGKTKLKPWLMDTAGKREEGMMFLKASDLKPNDAMLFVFPAPQRMQFWNQNVLFSLDVAFMDSSGKVIALVVLRAMDETPKGPQGFGQYVLEMKQGAFKRIGLKTGMKLAIPKGISGS